MVAQCTNHVPNVLKCTIGDAHIYSNHVEQCERQIENGLSDVQHPLPTLWLNPEITEIDKFTAKDIKIIDYKSHKKIKAPMAI
jgi:thymidylate synthase